MTSPVSAVHPTSPRWPPSAGRGLLVAALLVAAFVGSRGIADEIALSGTDDSPRYLMDGVFLYDFLRSGAVWTPRGAMSYAEHYFARYPALSLGHHPPLWPISLVPFYALFGVSVFAARLAVLTCFVLSVVLLYRLVARVYDGNVAGWASLLFASHPFVTVFAQRVPAEMLSIALVLAALDALVRFCDEGRLRDYVLFVAAALASLAARQVAVFMFPAYLALLVGRGGWPRLARRDVVIATLAGAVLLAPIAVATLLLAPFNVAIVGRLLSRSLSVSRLRALVPIVRTQLMPAIGLATALGLFVALLRRDRRILVGAYWMASVLAGVLLVTGPVEPARYSILAVPAYCLCAASLGGPGRSRGQQLGLTAVLAVAVASQLWWAKDTRPAPASAYEEAARFVLADAGGRPAPTVLYSASLDTGNFVFFVRKHDPAQRLVVLRSDKLLTTSLMGRLSVEDRIGSPQDIYPLLDRYGTKFIVIEDRPSGSVVLDWLRDELRGDRFIERRRMGSALGGTSLVVYEYAGATSPDPDAAIDISIPLVGREIHIPLAELLPAEAD